MSGSTSGSSYFSTTKRGEIQEWRDELNSPDKDKKKEAVKKVIAAMTVGRDVSSLFPDVVKCIQTNNIELKKLVYLYIMNYAKSQPQLCILAVNTFVKDSQDPNPLVRALAVRTMSCIRVDNITEYLAEPLRKALRDEDPYVRKTAAVAVAKLYDINAQLVEDQGFLDLLKDLLSDSNPMVVANAVASLAEMSERSSRPILDFSTATVQKLLAAVNECTEWGQVFILDSLAQYTPRDPLEAESICERVAPRLQHANAAVVLSATKVILRLLDLSTNEAFVTTFVRKLAPPLVTLLSADPEIQYVALRNIDLVVQKRPTVLEKEVRVFFCKYNDPIYVKMEKLEIMIKLASDKNIDQVLLEFKEYATEVDVEFVRKAVRAIGRCAIKLERATQKCIDVLLELIQTKVNYVVQEAIIVIKDIFRKYPNRYESIIGTLCENLDTLDEPEAKASMIWIIGEYADRIENAGELLDVFLGTFHDESPQVQLQLLTATVKLFLKKPTEAHDMVQKVLNLSTEESDNPDLRDRGYVYWRLLSTDPEAAKAVVLADKPTISDDSGNIETSLLNQLVQNIATLSSIYHKPPELFVPDYKSISRAGLEEYGGDDEEEPSDRMPDSSDISYMSAEKKASRVDDLLDLSDLTISPGSTAAPSVAKPAAPVAGNPLDFDDIFGAAPTPAVPVVQKNIVLTADKGKGLQISSSFVRLEGQIFLEMTFENQSSAPLMGFAVQFNKNTFGLVPASPLQVPSPLHQGVPANVSLPLAVNPSMISPGAPSRNIQIALKNNLGVLYFQDVLPFNVFLGEDGRLERQDYLGTWRSIDDLNERSKDVEGNTSDNTDVIKKKLEAKNVFFVAKRSADAQDNLYFSAKTVNNVTVLLEITIFKNTNRAKISTKTTELSFVPFIEDTVTSALKA